MVKEELIQVLREILNFDEQTAALITENVSTENEMLRLVQILKSKRISDQSINNEAYSIKWLHTYFLLESLVFCEEGKKSEKLRTLFRNNLTLNEKKTLLTGFMFSEPYTLGESWYPCRHIMFEYFNQDENFKGVYLIDDKVPETCSLNTCYCGDWLNDNPDNIDDYINKLVDKFREIRNSVVHESFPIIFLPSYEGKKTAASFTASVIDAYPIFEKDKFRAYECYLDPENFFQIITNCIIKYVRSKYLNTRN